MSEREYQRAVETNHSPKCLAMMGDFAPICRCATLARAEAEVASTKRITFVGPVGKGREIHGRDATRDAYEAVKRLF